MDTAKTHIILYELNEVPWEIIDLYISLKPHSNLAKLLEQAQCITTVNEDPNHLEPWNTWPTFHNSMYSDDHVSFRLGQDPSTFRGTPLWQAAEDHRCSIGLFGPLQSWPAHKPQNGGFYIPDTFSRDALVYPAELSTFQTFNLAMTKENSSATTKAIKLDAKMLPKVVASLLRQGLSLSSIKQITSHLLQERLDARHQSRRPMMQTLLAFDLYWQLHRRHRPQLSIFFTNHVASMMHRFWGDAVPRYAAENTYQPDQIYQRAVPKAMDIFDRQLGHMMDFIATYPEHQLIIASSMGQGPVPYDSKVDDVYILEDVTQLLTMLGVPKAELGLAMYPRVSLEFSNHESALAAVPTFESVQTPSGQRLFLNPTIHGRTLAFELFILRQKLNGHSNQTNATLASEVQFATHQGEQRSAQLQDIGLAIHKRLGGKNTAYHIPEGIAIAYGSKITPDSSRSKISVLDMAPSILRLLGVPAAASMQGQASVLY